jgi:hypothetical protein
MGPWCALAPRSGFIFAPRVSRFLAGIFTRAAMSDFLQHAYIGAKGNN